MLPASAAAAAVARIANNSLDFLIGVAWICEGEGCGGQTVVGVSIGDQVGSGVSGGGVYSIGVGG